MLTDTLGWRSIFFINLPIGVVAFVGGVSRLRESRHPAGGRADWVGTVLVTGALTALMFALIRGNAMGWGSPAIVVLFAVAAVAFAVFVMYELRFAAAPMADLRLFGRRSFAATGFVAPDPVRRPPGGGPGDRSGTRGPVISTRADTEPTVDRC